MTLVPAHRTTSAKDKGPHTRHQPPTKVPAMNLNKYDAQGYPYTAEEAAERATAIFAPRMFYAGYKREVYPTGNPLAGMPIPEATVKPYNVGRNAAKRAARQIRGIRK